MNHFVFLVALVSSFVCHFFPVSVNADIVTTGRASADLASFDRVMLKFLQDNDVPGASLAVSRQGKLIYSRGYGWADVEAKAAVKPESLFHIASVSKPITATAVMKLVQDKKLKLDDRVFSILKLTPHLALNAKIDPRWEQITVLQLLQHTAGWDREVSFDPMFRSVKIATELGVPAPAGPEHVIRYMLGQPLDFNPGERYAYSNFGYCVLGRIIERVAKEPYEDYLKKAVLRPLGITTMKIGRTQLAGRSKNEVRYYTNKNDMGASVFASNLGQPVPQPYGAWCLEAMDAHGAWIASASDLVKFAMQFDAPPARSLLKDSTLKLMFDRPSGRAGHEESGEPTPFYYSCGWLLRPIPDSPKFNIWHNGALSGTSTLLVRRHDSLCWAVLFNSRDTEPAPSSQLDPLLHQAASEVVRWPN